jgi:hypothetical protein
VLWSVRDDLEYFLDEREWDAAVEQVAHAVDEHRSWGAPAIWLVQCCRVRRNAETRARGSWVPISLVFIGAHGLESLGEGQGVAVIASCRYAVTAGRRVPGDLCPLDACLGCHVVASTPVLATVFGAYDTRQ